MKTVIALLALPVLIALGVWQMRSAENGRGRDFAIIAIIALMVTLYYS